MLQIIKTTIVGIFRDRIFYGIIALAVLFFFVPSVASLSMRQVTELSITLSLSLISIILLLLAVFLGATSIWRDMERRYTLSTLSLPLSRSSYVLGRFFGLSLFLVMTSVFLGVIACIAISVSASIYPSDRPVHWDLVVLALVFSTLKYILLVAVAVLLSTVSTSFFLPIFGTISLYFSSGITQQVFDYIYTSVGAKDVTPLVKAAAAALYYILPNLTGFNLNVNAIYQIPPKSGGILLTCVYFIGYTAILLGSACLLFERREMK
ncbi:MAG: ABC transporter permease [Geobacter sp.]